MKLHNKRYYGGLIVIVFIILATAFLLQMYGTVDRGDIAGLAAEPTEQESVEDLLEKGGTVEITYGTEKYTIHHADQKYVLEVPPSSGAFGAVSASYSADSYDKAIDQLASVAKRVTSGEMKAEILYDGKIFSSQSVTLTSSSDINLALTSVTEGAVTEYHDVLEAEKAAAEPAPEDTEETAEEAETGAETGDTGDTGDSEEDETGDTGAEEAGDTGETAQEDTGEEGDTGYTEEEITSGEVPPEQIAVETPAQEEIFISYKDINGNEYSWGGKITYDSITKTYTIDLDKEPDLLGYTDKGELLNDLESLLPTATSITLKGIKEGEVVTETANVDNLESLKTVLEGAETAALSEAAKTEEKKAAATGTGAAAAPKRAEVTGRYSEEDKKFIITTAAGKNVELQMVAVNGKPYGRYVGEKAIYYYDKDGKVYKMNNEGELVPHSDKSTLVTGEALKNLVAVLSDKEKTKDFPEDEQSKASREAKKAVERQQKLTSLATEYGVTATDLENEETAIDTYLQKNYEKEKWDYDAATEHYTGGTNGITYDGDNMGIKVTETKEEKETTQTVYKEREKGKTTYYVCTNEDCSETEKVKETDALEKQFREAEKEQDRIVNSVGNGIRSGDIKNKVTINGKEVVLKTTIAEAHYLQKQYEQQRTQVKGLLTGYLNKWLDKQLGGWSRGVPAGICAQVFGLEYYKEAGWNRVPMNASSYELQSYLLANSKTVIIEGEKEEITDSLFRYAYTLRLLANQSFEWQTYLYNSCSQETSEEVFYDYGSLGAGEFYSFHYAGAAEQDMIFDCAQEDCLFDQACVEFTDGSEAVCVSLVHGAGFETPNAGSDYDCV